MTEYRKPGKYYEKHMVEEDVYILAIESSCDETARPL